MFWLMVSKYRNGRRKYRKREIKRKTGGKSLRDAGDVECECFKKKNEDSERTVGRRKRKREGKKERKKDWCDADPRRWMYVSILRREEINPRR